jgi:hypothetical protein
MDDDPPRTLALWKLSVLGPLISVRLEHGDRLALLLEAAARTHQRPDGRLVRLSARTLEAWLYAYRRGGVAALAPQARADRGASRAIAPDVADLLVRAKRERPRRSIRRLIRLLERAGVVRISAIVNALIGSSWTRRSVHRERSASDAGRGLQLLGVLLSARRAS